MTVRTMAVINCLSKEVIYIMIIITRRSANRLMPCHFPFSFPVSPSFLSNQLINNINCVISDCLLGQQFQTVKKSDLKPGSGPVKIFVAVGARCQGTSHTRQDTLRVMTAEELPFFLRENISNITCPTATAMLK